MSKELDPMDKFNFLLGNWKMESEVPKSQFSSKDKGEGVGEFKRILNNQYVTFDYSAEFAKGKGSAHGIFTWDKKSKIYRYWWFEDSGEFMEATCDFINENALCLNWHNSLLVQTFDKTEDGKIVLLMKYPESTNKCDLVLKVVFTKIK